MVNDKESTGKQATWSRYDDGILIQTLKQEKALGHWGDNNPKKVAWTKCEAALTGSEVKSGGVHKTTTSIKNRYQRVRSFACVYAHALITIPSQLKKDYEIVKKLREQSGWGWDPVNNVPDVALPVWEEYVAVSYIHDYEVQLYLNTPQSYRNIQRPSPFGPNHSRCLTTLQSWSAERAQRGTCPFEEANPGKIRQRKA
jgi:hypothetical protein